MLVERAVQLAVLAAAGALLCARGGDAATSDIFRLCGRQLSNILSKICRAYNSPAWDEPLEEQPDSVVRKRRQVSNGIADECCVYGCNWEQLTSYCAVRYSSDAVHEMEAHMIADRSTEAEAAAAVEGGDGGAGATRRSARGEVGRRSRGNV